MSLPSRKPSQINCSPFQSLNNSPTPKSLKRDPYSSLKYLSSEEIRVLKEDIIKWIKDEFKKLNEQVQQQRKAQQENSQPVFQIPEIPQQSKQQEPEIIYVPRNVYVPVIKPIFVPRERIIVQPKIVHVSKPVIVDRPIPTEQKPIVIERDVPLLISNTQD